MKLTVISFAHMHAFCYAKALPGIEGIELAGIVDL